MKTFCMFIILTLSSVAFAKPAENVESFLKGCFKDYVAAFASPDKDSATRSAQIRERCLTKEFRRFWFKIISKTDADGWLLAQDHKESWKKNIEIKDLNEAKKSAKVILGTAAEQHCLTVTYLVETDLKIDIVSKCKK